MLVFGMLLLMRGLLLRPVVLALPALPDRPAFALPTRSPPAIAESCPEYLSYEQSWYFDSQCVLMREHHKIGGTIHARHLVGLFPSTFQSNNSCTRFTGYQHDVSQPAPGSQTFLGGRSAARLPRLSVRWRTILVLLSSGHRSKQYLSTTAMDAAHALLRVITTSISFNSTRLAISE
jgi:hypothetical protein